MNQFARFLIGSGPVETSSKIPRDATHTPTGFVRGAVDLVRTAAAAVAGVLAMAGIASAGFTTPEDVAMTQTLTIQQLAAPGAGTFTFTEASTGAFNPVVQDITISNVLWATERVFMLNEVGATLPFDEVFVTQNIAGVAHFLYAAANDNGVIATIPNIANLPVITITPGETWGPVTLALAAPVGGFNGIGVFFISDGDPSVPPGISDMLQLTPVPEPSSLTLAVSAAVAGLGAWLRRRRRAAA